MGQSLEARQAHTAERFSLIEAALLSPAADGGDSCEVRYGPRATVYATGSYGRGEASQHSDLDLFIVSAESPAADDGKLGGPGSRRQTEPVLNDILRLWRTFCVNYENRTSDADEAAKAKRKLTHYKLSHSRLLTCYSGIVTLLATYRRKGTVSPSDVLELVTKTPRERIKEVGKVSPRSAKTATEVLDSYERFLDRTDVDEPALRQQFLDKTYARERMEEARQFAELIHDLVSSIDAGRLSRAIVV